MKDHDQIVRSAEDMFVQNCRECGEPRVQDVLLALSQKYPDCDPAHVAVDALRNASARLKQEAEELRRFGQRRHFKVIK
jgi:hypothetical protein